MTSSDLFRPKIDITVRRNQRPMKTTQTNIRSSSGISNGDRLLYVYFFKIMSIVRLHQSLDVSLKQLIEKYSENKCSPPEETDENQDPLEEDNQAGEDENQEVVDENQEEVDENQEEVEKNQEDEEENQEDEEEDQNKNKRGVSIVSSEYDSISSE
ncbi:uncharacterized protein OCT59_002703 [Rhizophagus irregularis]|uniref:uncharacterized protein n=1 Tax=Rhizophagus irregularis TaxID=588596 RepID=UPI00332E4157|nr:hypothetical protein OCT59_002703 [Rhizophagus irregularis]